MSDSKVTPPISLSYAQAHRFGPYSFASLVLGLLERYVTPAVIAELLEEKTNQETDRHILLHVASFWGGLGTDDPHDRIRRMIAALEELAKFEPAQSQGERRRPWLKAYVSAVLERYREPRRALEAMDILHAVLGYPDELTPLTTYRSDPGVPVSQKSASATSFPDEMAVADARNAAMHRFIL